MDLFSWHPAFNRSEHCFILSSAHSLSLNRQVRSRRKTTFCGQRLNLISVQSSRMEKRTGQFNDRADKLHSLSYEYKTIEEMELTSISTAKE